MTGAGTHFRSLVNDKVIHERARLLILTYLASNDAKAVPFSRLRESLDFSGREPVGTTENIGGGGIYRHFQGIQGQ